MTNPSPGELAANVHRCTCGCPLLLNWGLQVAASRDYPTPAGVNPHGKNYGACWDVLICAMCDKPWGLWDGELNDLDEIISQEDVRAVLLRLEKAPLAAKAAVRDP